MVRDKRCRGGFPDVGFHHMPASRCSGDGVAVEIPQRVQQKSAVAFRRDDFQCVADGKVVFDIEGGEAGFGVVVDDFGDELLGEV